MGERGFHRALPFSAVSAVLPASCRCGKEREGRTLCVGGWVAVAVAVVRYFPLLFLSLSDREKEDENSQSGTG